MEDVVVAKSIARRIVDAFDSVTWYLIFGWIVILHHCVYAVAIVICSPQRARSHLTIVKWAIHPLGKKVIYSSMFESSCCSSSCTCYHLLLIVLFPLFVISGWYMLIAMLLGQCVSCGRFSKFLENLEAVWGAKGELKIVDRNWMPPSVAQYDPSKKCRISLGSQNSKGDHTHRWVYIDEWGRLMADGLQCHIWDTFISEPVCDDCIILQREKDGQDHGDGIQLRSNPKKFRILTHGDDTFVFAENWPVACMSELSGLRAIKRCEGGQDAKENYYLECANAPTRWTVIVHEILDNVSHLDVVRAAAPAKQQEQRLLIEKPASILEDSSGTKQAVIVDPPSVYKDAVPYEHTSVYKDPPPYEHVADVPPTYI